MDKPGQAEMDPFNGPWEEKLRTAGQIKKMINDC